MENLLKDQEKKYLTFETRINGFSHFPDTKFVVVRSINKFYKMDLVSGKTTFIDTKRLEIGSFKCFSDNKILITDFDNNLHYCSIKEDDTIRIDKSISTEDINAGSIVATDDLATIAVYDYRKLFTLRNNESNKKSTKSDCLNQSGAVSNDGKIIALASHKAISLYDTNDLTVLKQIETEALAICMSFSPDNSVFIYGDEMRNIISIELASGNQTVYQNYYGSKPINIFWKDNTNFVCTFLSIGIGNYTLGLEKGNYTGLNDFKSRYFQHSILLNPNTLAICVEDLRDMKSAKDGIPHSDIVVIMSI